jgi:hypothetical protein
VPSAITFAAMIASVYFLALVVRTIPRFFLTNRRRFSA